MKNRQIPPMPNPPESASCDGMFSVLIFQVTVHAIEHRDSLESVKKEEKSPYSNIYYQQR
jgi:hypothetical protein